MAHHFDVNYVQRCLQTISAGLSWYFPLGHDAQLGTPSTVTYFFPAAQGVQMSEVASLVPVYPSVHAQADRLVLAAGELAFAPHGRHDVASSVGEYLPALHSVHTAL